MENNRGKYRLPSLKINGAGRGLASVFIIIFFTVGAIGLSFRGSHHFFIGLFPYALILSTLIMYLFNGPLSARSVLVSSIVAVSGFFLEVAGVATGQIFGEYTYGSTLGPKLLGVPLIIGLNWLMLTLAFSSLSVTTRLPVITGSLTGALFMTVYDILLEQCAAILGMWTWSNGKVPVRNYLAWFAASFLFQLLFRISGVSRKNTMAVFIIAVQALFLSAVLLANTLIRR